MSEMQHFILDRHRVYYFIEFHCGPLYNPPLIEMAAYIVMCLCLQWAQRRKNCEIKEGQCTDTDWHF